MTGPLVAAAHAVVPASVLDAGPARVLAAFVTINTVMYAALALAKVLPRVYPSTWFQRDNRRAEDRSIYPEGWTGPRLCRPAAGAGARPAGAPSEPGHGARADVPVVPGPAA
ncbi:hypothetical protein [Cellulomonas endophytica]|uniref:hypothetical protein n=1 Tax=Cellulomonas endophytica TaxID=2494735 RepID=UPI001012C193|nr:hypothetical protein [Cellulomonas endophytica]